MGGIQRGLGSKTCRMASAGRLFCAGQGKDGEGGIILLREGDGEVWARSVAAGRASRNGFATGGDGGRGKAAGDCSKREKGEFGLGELAQGGRREIVLRGGGKEGEAAGYCCERGDGGSGSKSCGRASAGILLCGGEGAAGDRAERGKGQSGPEELLQGERREMVLRGGGAEPEAAGYCSGREEGSGSKTCRRASAAGLFCAGRTSGGGRKLLWAGSRRVRARRAAAGQAPRCCIAWGRLNEIVLSRTRGSSDLNSCRKASAGRLLCAGRRRWGGGRRLL